VSGADRNMFFHQELPVCAKLDEGSAKKHKATVVMFKINRTSLFMMQI
jgi:hypothetical protein